MIEPLKKQNNHPPQVAPAVLGAALLKDWEFKQIRALIYDIAGISLTPTKKLLVSNRLAKRLSACGQASFGDYFRLITTPGRETELQLAVDLLTTNETHFFRETKHFDFLRQQVLPAHKPPQPFRVWSAACSSGEEPYSIAMLLADALGEAAAWDVVGSDISTRVLEKARSAVYPMVRSKNIPEQFLKRYCLKGIGAYADSFKVNEKLRTRVEFVHLNLNATLPKLGAFDVIFLCNVMIYFNADTKRQVVERMLPLLKPGGYFLVGHAETLGGVNGTLQSIAPSIYRQSW